jgi:hypothetical protein
VAVNDNTIFSMPLSRRWRFVTICGEGPGPRAVPRGRRLAPGPRARWASAVQRRVHDVGVARAGDVAANISSTNSTPTAVAAKNRRLVHRTPAGTQANRSS